MLNSLCPTTKGSLFKSSTAHVKVLPRTVKENVGFT